MRKQPQRSATFLKNGNWTLLGVAITAHQRGIVLQTREWQGSCFKYTWKCPQGHAWDSRIDGIVDAKGCPTCYWDSRLEPEELKKRKRDCDRRLAAKKKPEKAVYDKARRLEKLEEIRAYDRMRYARDPEKAKADRRRYTANPVNRATVARRSKKRYRENVQHRICVTLRNSINRGLKKGKAGSAIRDLGCTIPELKKYLESKFQTGMTWENQGSWHIDHIRPLVSFDLTDRAQFCQAVHYTNLQPLWARDNLVKGKKWER